MKRISEFIINKVSRRNENIVGLFTNVDAESQHFEIKIENSGGDTLTEFSKDLEFLLRANDVSLSKNLMKFLEGFLENEQLNLPFSLFSESSISKKSRPRQPQAA